MRITKKIGLFILCLGVLAGCAGVEESQKPKRQLLLISFDGFRHDYLDKAPTPNFDSLAENGVQAEGLIPVFPTKTFPNHYSVATGWYSENTGLVANTMFDPEFGEWYRISDRKAVENKKWYGGEPIWNTVEKQGLKAGTLFWVGSAAEIQNLRPTYWKRFDGSMPDEARIDTVVKWMSYPDSEAVDFAALYFELVDEAGHGYGLNSDSLAYAIQKADSLMGYLKKELKAVNRWNNLNLIILSDHGMIDLAVDKTIRLDTIIDMSDVERIIWAPVTMIQPIQGKAGEIYKTLKANEQHYKVYRKENIPQRYHIKNHRRVPEVIVVADLGYTLLDENYRERFLSTLPSATHGFDNNAKAMHALFAAHGPVFKKGKTVPAFQNIHLYELMSYLLGIHPAPNDGSLDSIKVLLK